MRIDPRLHEKLSRLSLDELSELRKRATKPRKRAHLPALNLGQRKNPLPLSFAQMRLWFIHQHMPGQESTYNLPMALGLDGPLNCEFLREAFAVLVARHEVLRTSFEQRPGEVEPVQRIAERLALDIPLIEATAEQVQDYGRTHAAHVFDLSCAPLLKVSVLRLSAEEHVLLINMHHIVADRWSLGILSRELSQAYGALSRSEPVNLPALAVQYADYACWQRELDLQSHLHFWRKTLAGYEGGLELPYDHARPPTRVWRAGYLRYRYPVSLSQELGRWGQKQHATLFMMLLAGFAIVLRQYTRRDDVVIGTTTAGRDRVELEPLIGFFVNVLPLRVDLSGDPTGWELIERVKAMTVDALAHQALPFEHILNELRLKRDFSQAPIVPVMLRHQNLAPATFAKSVLSFVPPNELEVSNEGYATSELDLQFYGDARGLEVKVEYALDLFEPATIARLLERHERVLYALLSNHRQRLSVLPALGELAERQLLVEWNRTARVLDERLSIVAIFEQQVRFTPQALACSDRNERWSYTELNVRANRVAHYLHGRQIGPWSRVALCLTRSCDFLAAMLGVFKAGAIYVPLDPGYPPAYLKQILNDADPKLIFTSTSLAARLDTDVETVFLEDQRFDQDCSNLSSIVSSDQAAYIAYTSGSVGRPKGVVVPHRQVLNWLQALWERIPCGAGDVTAQKTPLAFVVSIKELLAGLLRGGQVVFIDDEVLTDIPAFIEEMDRSRVSRLSLVPSHLKSLLEELGTQHECLRSLRHCITAGEPLTWQLCDQVSARLPWVKLWNNYGCTEFNDITYADPYECEGARLSVPIGRPIANTRVYVVDADLNPIPLGAIGELCVSGAGMPYGYWGQPGLTAERFVPDPFSYRDGDRLYKTGDLARYRASGQLDYVGRVDFDVKIRGNRVDVRQIEAILEQYPGIRLAVVKGFSTEPIGTQLAAYYLLHDGTAAPTPRGLREHLTAHLPAYMVPTYYIVLDALPRLPNGKLDRKALRTPDAAALASAENVPANDDTQRRMIEVWSELLGLSPERIGLHDDFFALGGHSLLAVQLMGQIRSKFLVDLPLRTVFEASNVADICARIYDLPITGAPSSPSIQARARPLCLPCSFAQEHVWFWYQGDSPPFTMDNMSWAFTVLGRFNVPALREAFAVLVARHEVLRTSFEQRPGEVEPVQRIAERLTLDIPLIEATAEQAQDYGRTHAAHVFDLSCAPLLKVSVLRLSAEEHILFITTHHMVFDGWSKSVMSRELSQAYGALSRSEPVNLPALAVQYADYACWQRELDLQSHLHFWRKTLAGYEGGLELPYDHARPPTRVWRAGYLRYRYPVSLSQELGRWGQKQHATLFMMLLAGFAIVLRQYTRRNDVVIGTTTAGRDRVELEPLIGFFVNVLPLRVDLSGDPTGWELIERVKAMTVDALAHQALPLQHMLKAVQAVRSTDRASLMPIMLRHQNFPAAPFGLSKDLQIQEISFNDGPSIHTLNELDLQFFGNEEYLEVQVSYASDLFEHSTVERLLEVHEHILQSLVADPQRRLSQIAAHSEQKILTGSMT